MGNPTRGLNALVGNESSKLTNKQIQHSLLLHCCCGSSSSVLHGNEGNPPELCAKEKAKSTEPLHPLLVQESDGFGQNLSRRLYVWFESSSKNYLLFSKYRDN